VPAGSRVCYELAPVRERLVTTFGEKPKVQIRMLPHRMVGAAWLDSKLERWPALGAAQGVDLRRLGGRGRTIQSGVASACSDRWRRRTRRMTR
jgi:hypothetical protein